ncbi:MAG TPA: hypothetical protein ENK18_05780 [Deltaproteobacteria bacterium]|nr:hypothetical protein [Deltaproteobacteria bacterium]
MNLLPLILLAACEPAPPERDCALGPEHLVIATTDYVSGALAAVDPQTGCVADLLSSLGPDPLVRALGDRVAVVDRSGGDTLRLFEVGAYERPVVEVVLEVEGNIHDVERVGDQLLVTLYDRDQVVVTDLDGVELGRIELGAHADADGVPEADQIEVVDSIPWLSLQRMTRGARWSADQPGRLVPLQLDTLTTGAPLEIGDNPRLVSDPLGGLAVLTGIFAEPDGALHPIDLQQGLLPPLVTEGELAMDLTHLVGLGPDDDRAVLLAVPFAEGQPSELLCLDRLTGAVTPGLQTDGWLRDAVAALGRVWVIERTGWGAAAGRAAALHTVDPASCTVERVTEAFALDPDSIAFVGGDL